MSHVCRLDEIQLADQSWAGAKAAYLGALLHAGFNVPRGFCVTTEAYRATIAEPLGEKIVARVKATEIDDPVDLESAAEEIRAWIETAPLPSPLVEEIRAALTTLSAQQFAVRVSRVVEDVVNPAASGLQQAYLAVAGIDAVLQDVRQCWSSPWNSRAIYFRHRKKMDPRQVTMAVVVQPMIEAETSGVMFTAHPLTGATDEIHIDATWGLGEAIIAARWKPDHFVVSKNDRAIRARAIPNKSVMDVAAPAGGLQTLVVPAEKQNIACLTDDQVVALADLGKQIETNFGAPQDIEWCRVGEEILILQTRPLKKK